jgi:hypothetical protein
LVLADDPKTGSDEKILEERLASLERGLEVLKAGLEPLGFLKERLASLERELEHLKAGLGLLGVKPCCWCGKFYRRSDPGKLCDCGELVCFDCIPQWWLHRSPELSTNDRQKAERELRQWLVSHHGAEVIGRAGSLPKPERLLVNLVIGCERCNGSGTADTGRRCSHCDGRGTVWVLVRAPDFGSSSE